MDQKNLHLTSCTIKYYFQYSVKYFDINSGIKCCLWFILYYIIENHQVPIHKRYGLTIIHPDNLAYAQLAYSKCVAFKGHAASKNSTISSRSVSLYGVPYCSICNVMRSSIHFSVQYLYSSPPHMVFSQELN